jgi:hypothetical protein
MFRAKTQSTPSSEKQENIFSLRPWRPFGVAQDMLGASESSFSCAVVAGKICAS